MEWKSSTHGVQHWNSKRPYSILNRAAHEVLQPHRGYF